MESLDQQILERELRKSIELKKEQEHIERISKNQEGEKRIIEEERSRILDEHNYKMALLDKKIERTRWLTQRLKLSPLRLKLWEDDKIIEENKINVEHSEVPYFSPVKNEDIMLLSKDSEEDVIDSLNESCSFEKSEEEEEIEEGVSEDITENMILQEIATPKQKDKEFEKQEEDFNIAKSLFNDSLEDLNNKDLYFDVELPFSTVIELSIGQPILLQY